MYKWIHMVQTSVVQGQLYFLETTKWGGDPKGLQEENMVPNKSLCLLGRIIDSRVWARPQMLGLTVHSWGRQVVSENYKSSLLSQLLVRFHPRMCYLHVFLQTIARVTWQQGWLWQLGESVCLLSAVCGRWAWYFTINVWGANFQCKDDSQGFRMCKYEAQSHFYRHWCSPTATPTWADAKLFGLPGNSQNLLRRAIRGQF